MGPLDGFSRAGAIRVTGVLVAAVAVAACCVGVSPAAAAVVNVGSFPCGVSSDGTHVWVTNAGEASAKVSKSLMGRRKGMSRTVGGYRVK
jgi:hypothetical protein